MTLTTPDRGTVSSTALDILLLTAKAVVAADVRATCTTVLLDRQISGDQRQMTIEVCYDATVALAEARETLVDMGADPTRCTALDDTADDAQQARTAFLTDPPDLF